MNYKANHRSVYGEWFQDNREEKGPDLNMGRKKIPCRRLTIFAFLTFRFRSLHFIKDVPPLLHCDLFIHLQNFSLSISICFTFGVVKQPLFHLHHHHLQAKSNQKRSSLLHQVNPPRYKSSWMILRVQQNDLILLALFMILWALFATIIWWRCPMTLRIRVPKYHLSSSHHPLPNKGYTCSLTLSCIIIISIIILNK